MHYPEMQHHVIDEQTMSEMADVFAEYLINGYSKCNEVALRLCDMVELQPLEAKGMKNREHRFVSMARQSKISNFARSLVKHKPIIKYNEYKI